MDSNGLFHTVGPDNNIAARGALWEAPVCVLPEFLRFFISDDCSAAIYRGEAPGPHRNTARQAMDGLWTEVCGQQKQSIDPGNNQHILNTPIIGRR